MAKAIYGRLFGWIVNKVNQLLAPKENLPPEAYREIGTVSSHIPIVMYNVKPCFVNLDSIDKSLVPVAGSFL